MAGSATSGNLETPVGTRDVAADTRGLRAVICTVILLVYWVSLDPFHDRSGAALTGTLGAGNIVNQIVFPALFLVTVAIVAITRPGYYRRLAAPAFLIWIVWVFVSTLASGDPSTGLKRGLFEIMGMIIAAAVVALPENPRQFAGQLAITAFVVLALCYLGVVFLPALSIHQTSDALERELAGAWRGIFNHKNQAGAMMAVIIFTGLYVADVRSRLMGWTLIALAGTFLVFSMSKSTMGLLPFSLLVTAIAWRLKSTAARFALIVTPLVVLNVATVGSSWPGPVRSLVGMVLTDTSFTARTDLWRFSVKKTFERPYFGYGMTGPWRTDALMYQDKLPPEPEDISGWVTELGTDSHNSYLEGALQFGIPGLLLLLLAVIYQPLKDFGIALERANNKALVLYFSRIWIFVLYLAALETVLLTRNNPMWFMTLVSIAGMHILARYPAASADSR